MSDHRRLWKDRERRHFGKHPYERPPNNRTFHRLKRTIVNTPPSEPPMPEIDPIKP